MAALGMSVLEASPRQAQEAPAADGFEYALPINPYELTPDQLRQALKTAKDAGVTSVSAGATWQTLDCGSAPTASCDRDKSSRETRQQTREANWRTNPWYGAGKSSLESLIAEATVPGMEMKVHLQLNGPSDWAPRTEADLNRWSEFVTDTVRLSNDRVSSFEMWNEPNLPRFWPTNPGKERPDPGEYVKALRAGYFAAKNADTDTTNENVVFAGLSHNDVGYLKTSYQRADDLPQGEAAANRYYFDVLGVHPYAYDRSPQDDTGPVDPSYGEVADGYFIDRNFKGLSKMKEAMKARGGAEPTKTIWIGEMGYATDCTKTVHCVADRDAIGTEAKDVRRAEYLKEAYALARGFGYVDGMSWYHYLPNGFFQPGSDDDAGWNIARFEPATTTNLRVTATFEALRQVATQPQVEALQTDKGAYAPGERVMVTATLSAVEQKTLRQVVVAARPKGGGANFDFGPPQDNVAVGPTPRSFTVSRTFDSPGTYEYFVAYYDGVSWHNLTPVKELSVGSPTPTPTPAPAPAPAPTPTPAPVAGDTGAVRVGDLWTSKASYAPGEPVRASAKVTAEKAGTLDRLVIAVRPKGGSAVLVFPTKTAVAVGPAVTTHAFEKAFRYPGVYQMFVAYEDGAGWKNLAPTKEFRVAAPAPPPPAPNTRPEILSPSPVQATRDRTPTIRSVVRDSQTNLAKDNISLFVDGRRKAFSYNQATDRLTYTNGALRYGRHTVKVVANDGQLSASRTWRFNVVR